MNAKFRWHYISVWSIVLEVKMARFRTSVLEPVEELRF